MGVVGFYWNFGGFVGFVGRLIGVFWLTGRFFGRGKGGVAMSNMLLLTLMRKSLSTVATTTSCPIFNDMML